MASQSSRNPFYAALVAQEMADDGCTEAVAIKRLAKREKMRRDAYRRVCQPGMGGCIYNHPRGDK